MSSTFSTRIKIGVLGGGQLGRMLIQKAIDLGIDLRIMDVSGSPCEKHAANFTVGDIRNYDDVMAFGKELDVLTIEIENIHVGALRDLEKHGVKVLPQPSAIALIQDKGEQKKFYNSINVPTASFELLESRSELEKKPDLLPAVQKLRKGGYDGKGVQILKSADDIPRAFDAASVLETLVDLEKELSVIVSRDVTGNTVCFPPVEQVFNPEANLVEFLFSPAGISDEVAAEAERIATKIIEALDMTGILAVEFFLDKSGNLLVNEIAPRPHNSGHQTIEGNYTSQFEQHLRAICGLPLGSTAIIMPSVMINLLGDKGSSGKATYEGIYEVMAIPGVYPHIYGKEESKPFRKMGHVTIIHPDLNKAKELALKVKKTIRVIGK